MKKTLSRSILLPLFIIIFGLFACPLAFSALDPLYMRNGECYLLLGEGAFKGVYRLNNPAGDAPRVGYLYNPGVSIGISVDLDRGIYTFSENIDPGFTLISGNIQRQVVDTVAADHVDYGYHTWIHTDHRSWGAGTNVYRTGPVGRAIKRNGGGTWGGFTSAGPGTAISTPNPLPAMDTVQIPLPVEPGKQWYDIPNGSWFSSWQTKTAVNNGYTYFYTVFGDKVEAKYHNWTLNLWHDIDYPGGSTAGGVVGQSQDTQISRRQYAGCLDGCGGASGSGTGVAKPIYTSVAFMPPLGITTPSPSRTYFYTREKDSPANTITLSVGGGSPSAYGGAVIGDRAAVGSPVERGTRWIGVSLQDQNNDYVYCLGTSVIGSWYTTAMAAPPPANMTIEAVTVSNQWNQSGGIVYAFDKSNQAIHQFKRDENRAPYVFIEGYNYIPLSFNIDDIKADGFGNLYFSRTVRNPDQDDPKGYFDLDSDVIASILDSTSGGIEFGTAVFAQTFAKTVYQRDITTGVVSSVGSQDIGSKFYARTFQVPATASAGIFSAPYGSFNTRLASAGGSFFTPGWAGSPYADTLSPPNLTELAVINVPTPSMVHQFPDGSHLDIVGPFLNFPVFSFQDRHTNQLNPIALGTLLNAGTIYFCQVENYPLEDPPQNPLIQPDWNGNGFLGGFVTTITNPWPSMQNNSGQLGAIYYQWRLWTVAVPDRDAGGNLYYRYVDPVPSPDSPQPDYPARSDDNHTFGMVSPFGGKYILTCRVTYDWYDYTQLPFGAMYSDRNSVIASGVTAVTRGRSFYINEVSTVLGLPSSMTTAIQSNAFPVIPDDTYAVIPLDFNLTPPPGSDTFTTSAKIERCNYTDSTAPKSDVNWSGPGTNAGVNSGKPYHGIWADREYSWRLALASQSNLQFDITTSNSPANNYVVELINDPTSSVAQALATYSTQASPLFYRGFVGETRWKGVIQSVGEITYFYPNGSSTTVPLTTGYINASSTPSNISFSYIKAKIPIPTDPAFAKIRLEISRWSEIRLWANPTVNGTPMWFPAAYIPFLITINGESDLLVLDKNPPALVEELTSPRNLFGVTGEDLAAGVGPTGLGNADVQFVVLDDNPWESDNAVTGVSSDTSNTNRNDNIDYKWGGPSYFDSSYNLKPVFSKAVRMVSFVNDYNSAPSTHTYSIVQSNPSALTTFVPLTNPYVGFTPGFALPAISFTATSASFLSVTIPLSQIKVDPVSTKVPANYANNSPDYQPHSFSIVMKDSSGNQSLEAQLNCVLNIRDGIAPIPWAIMTNKKTPLEPSIFPDYEHTVPAGGVGSMTSFNMALQIPVASSPRAWTSNSVGEFNFSDSTTMKVLQSISDDIVTQIDGGAYTALVQQVRDKLAPPYYLEDNVEFVLSAGVSDNCGEATNTIEIKNLDLNGNVDVPWTARTEFYFNAGKPVNDVLGPIIGIFRGRPDQFPIAFPVSMVAVDNALAWDYYADVNNNPQGWTSVPGNKFLFPASPAPAPNTRTLRTSIVVYDSRMRVRILDRSLSNR